MTPRCFSTVVAALRSPRALWLPLLLLPGLALADEKGKAAEAGPDKNGKAEAKEEKETKSVTDGEVTLGGQRVAYTTTAGTLPLTKADGEKRASVFYIAYERKNPGDLAKRPVTFCFNGGPGSSSVWLHLGAFGPKRVALPPDGIAPPKPPYQIIPNEYSLLDASDLIFIDPVSTGFSRAEKPDEAKQFHGYQEDLQSVGEFIHRYISKNGRWASPKFLAGESYGGLRAAGLSGHLQDRYGMYLNGIAIVSGVIDFQTISSGGAINDLPYVTFLPGFAATAHFHQRLAAEWQAQPVEAVIAAARKFATGPYAAALLQGLALPEETQESTAAELARLTGLSPDLWKRARLRISAGEFRRRLLEDRSQVLGRFDARVLADVTADDDPSYSNIYGAFATGLNSYVRGELKYDSDLPYEILTGDVRPWNYNNFAGRPVSALPALADALSGNPDLRIFVATGHYDFATPGLAIEHSLNHLATDPARLANITYGHYEGGHMMYTITDSLARLSKDLHAFLTQ